MHTRATVSLLIQGKNLHLPSITTAIGLEPSRLRMARDPFAHSRAGKGWLFSAWDWCSGDIMVADIPDLVEKLVGHLERAGRIAGIGDDGKISISIGIFGPRSLGDCFWLPPAVLRRLGEVGGGLFVDVYPPRSEAAGGDRETSG